MSTAGADLFTAHLNAPQGEAVAHVEGPMLVFAGAGSGKTRVITFRIANLIATHRVAPYRILAVTFTNKAAQEMRARLEQIMGAEVARDAWVGTFHATCAKLLRRYAEAVGLTKSFVIYDDADQRAVVSRVLKELELDDRSYPPRQMLGRIMKEKQEGRRPSDLPESGSFTDEVLGKVFEAYERHLKSSNAVDFEDLLGHVMRIAEAGETQAGRELQERFDFVLVDEFQDTNQVQYRLVRALVAKHHNLCVVGDDDQSIYRWRGSDVRIIRGFKRDFPEARIVKLEENYRSTGRIVRAALGVISPSREREPKELFTRNVDGNEIALVSARDERDEAAFILFEVKQAIARGVEAGNIAVFYRIHAMSRVLEEAFRSENVPYRIVGGTRFFDRAEVKDFLAYLRVVLNPRSDVDLLRIVNVPARGLGDTTVARLTEMATQRQTSLFDALDHVVDTGASAIAGAARKKLGTFRDMLQGFRRGSEELSPSELAHRILDETGYRKWLETEDSAEADARLGNLEELIGSIEEFEAEAEASGSAPTLAAYLERVTLSTSADEQKDAPRVSLMTVHSAKGLEFDSVFLVGMEEDLFPYVRRGEESGDEEEERRLAYVAITRARRRLFLTHVAVRTLFGTSRYGQPSRFLRDLPASDVAQQSTRAAAQPGYGSGGSASSAFSSRFGGGAGRPAYSRGAPAAPAWSPRQSFAPPRAAAPAAARPGERYVERDEPDAPSGDGVSLARGLRVKHPRFGEGTITEVSGGLEPSAVVRFPGWGEKKILARFLELALTAQNGALPDRDVRVRR